MLKECLGKKRNTSIFLKCYEDLSIHNVLRSKIKSCSQETHSDLKTEEQCFTFQVFLLLVYDQGAAQDIIELYLYQCQQHSASGCGVMLLLRNYSMCTTLPWNEHSISSWLSQLILNNDFTKWYQNVGKISELWIAPCLMK